MRTLYGHGVTTRRRIAVLLGVFLIVTLGVLPARAAPLPPAPTYVAVIDAGSGGTRISLYETGAAVTATRVYRAPSTSAALSSYVADPSAAGPDAVKPLLDQLSAYLGEQGIAVNDVPVALLATAGMRLVKLQYPVATRAIFASTRATLDASDFPVLANRILPATQEALLAWLDANARAATINTPAKDVGIVEMGGASAQVAFRSPRTMGPGVSTVTISGRQIGVVAVSYLGLGVNEARGLMQAVTSGGELCFPNNESGTDPVDYVAASPLPVPSDQADFLAGRCSRAYASVIRDVASTSIRDIRPRNLSKLAGFSRATFVGLGAIPFTYSDFKIPANADERISLQRAVRSTCKGADAWADVRSLYPAPTPSVAETLCANGAYTGELLFGPFGIGLDPASFDAQADLPGGAPSWAEGYAITVLHP